jgi:MFS family permease
MSARPTSPTRQNLRYSTKDGVAFSAMLGVGEANIVVFALAVGFGDVLAGLLGAVPLLGGALLQLMTARMVRLLGSHKKWVVICAYAQSATFLPLGVAAVMGQVHPLVLFGAATAYWACNFGAGAAWFTFVNPLIPARVRARYFARRTVLTNLALVTASFAAGVALFYGKAGDHALTVFAVLFFLAFIFRFVSATYLALQHELVPIPPDHRDVPLRELVTRFRRGPGGRLIAYMLAVQIGLQVSSPFVSPYMLKQLQLEDNYAIYGGLVASLLLAKVIALPLLGRIAHARGAKSLLWIGGLAIVPIPALWVLGTNVWYLLAVQLLSGAALAAYELATFLLLFETIDDHERTSVMCRFQLFNCTALVGGSLVGAGILQWIGQDPRGYTVVFLVATGVRLATVALLVRLASTPKDRPPPDVVIELHAQGGAPDDAAGARPDERTRGQRTRTQARR